MQTSKPYRRGENDATYYQATQPFPKNYTTPKMRRHNYSGEHLLGIVTMHKSNAVPVSKATGGYGSNPKITGEK